MQHEVEPPVAVDVLHARALGRVVLDLLTVKFLSGFATRPIQLFGLLGVVLGSAGIVLTGWLGFERLVMGERLAGRPLVLLAILLTVIGVQFVSIGLLGEMVVRIEGEDLQFFLASAVAKTGLSIAGGLKADADGWQKPFGIQWLVLKDVVLRP